VSEKKLPRIKKVRRITFFWVFLKIRSNIANQLLIEGMMSKFNLYANPKEVNAGWFVFWQTILLKDFSTIVSGKVQRAQALKTLAGLLLLCSLTGFLCTSHSWA
jgi:hypothetical protein